MSWFAQCYVDHLVAAVRFMCYRMLNGVCLYNNTCNSITYSQQFQVCIELLSSCEHFLFCLAKIWKSAFWVDHWFNYCLFCIFDNESTFLHLKVVTSCWGVRVTSIFEHSAIICFSSLWYYVLWLFLLLCFCLIIINVSILTQFKIKWKNEKNFFENYFDLACIWLQMLMIGMGFLGLLSYWNSIPCLKLMFKAQV